MSRAAIKVSKENIWYVSMNDFLKLDETQKEEMQKDLKEMDEYNELLDSLSRIQYFYPENPLSFIFDGNQPIIEDEQESLNKFEIELEKLFDKTSRESALVHGTTMYLVSVSGKLFLQKGSILGNFTVIEHYPNSEKSRKVAAAVRAFITNFIGMNDDEDQEGWSNYFWNRGLQIAECSIERSIPNEN